MLNKRVKKAVLCLGMSLAVVCLATGCSKLKKPVETESETDSEKLTESEAQTESESETEPQTELKTDIAYTSQDKSIKITLPDSTWKITQDADEMRVFQSGSAAMISIVHASNESQMRSLSVSESKEALTETLTKQYANASAFEVVDFKTADADTLKTYEYVVKYNNSTSMWAYSITYGILADKEAYVIQGTVTDDNKVLLDAVQKSVESFTVLRSSVFSALQNPSAPQQTEQQQSETEPNGNAELNQLTEYGTTATLYASDNVNVRLDPSTGSNDNIFGSLNKGDQVIVVGETPQWFKVNINGNIGYVSKAFLVNQPVTSTEDEQQEEPDEQRPQADSSTKTNAEMNSRVDYDSTATFYTTAEVNIRTQPGTDSGVVDVCGGGQTISVIGETDNWFIVSVNGTTGYVSKSYVSASDPGITSGNAGTDDGDDGGSSNGGDNGNSGGDGGGSQASGTGTVSGTIVGASASTITVSGDDGNTYTINTTDAAVSTDDGIYEGLYVSVNVDYANTTPSGELYATSVTGY